MRISYRKNYKKMCLISFDPRLALERTMTCTLTTKLNLQEAVVKTCLTKLRCSPREENMLNFVPVFVLRG